MSDINPCSGDCANCNTDCLPGEDGGINVTLNLDDGSTVECAILTIYEAAGRDYIALLPLNENGENETGEVYLYRYTVENGQPSLDNIEDDDEYEAASDGFDQWLDEQEYDELVSEKDDAADLPLS